MRKIQIPQLFDLIRQMGKHIGSPLHCVVQWFKTITTNENIHGLKRTIGNRLM